MLSLSHLACRSRRGGRARCASVFDSCPSKCRSEILHCVMQVGRSAHIRQKHNATARESRTVALCAVVCQRRNLGATLGTSGSIVFVRAPKRKAVPSLKDVPVTPEMKPVELAAHVVVALAIAQDGSKPDTPLKSGSASVHVDAPEYVRDIDSDQLLLFVAACV